MAKTILMVDDAELFLQVEQMIFQRTGARVLTAKTGTRALQIASETQPDIVLLDLNLPDIPGDRVCAQLKSHPLTSGIPVLIVTAHGDSAAREACRAAGCDGFMTKPIKNQELVARVAELLKVPHRHNMRILVRIHIEGGVRNESFFATSTNLSKSGMFLETDKPLRTGEEIQLRFFLPGQKEMAVQGRIVREDRSGATIGYGVQFQAIEPALEKFIDGKLRS